MSPFVIILIFALVIAFISALILHQRGYSFLRSLITWFLAAAGILSLVYRLLRDYL